MGEALTARAVELHAIWSRLSPETLTRTFVSEYRADGERLYESLWFFSQGYMLEVHSFPNGNVSDMAPTRNRLRRLELDWTHYRPGDAPTDSSRFTVGVSHSQEADILTSQLKASGENCDTLYRLVAERLIPDYPG